MRAWILLKAATDHTSGQAKHKYCSAEANHKDGQADG
jgi:hypothetical protein